MLVKHFADYHEIAPYAVAQGYANYRELGCFPVIRYDFNRYFGVFWKDKKPSKKAIFTMMFKVGLNGNILHHFIDNNFVEKSRRPFGYYVLVETWEASWECISLP